MAMTASVAYAMTYPAHMVGALSEVKSLEGGRVINDHYDVHKYVHRRALFLGTRAAYKDPSLHLFDIARIDAAAVFDLGAPELSVQEIRRRELSCGIHPLLPLPTTENTQTIDNFKAYPPSEWTPDWSLEISTAELNRSRETTASPTTIEPKQTTRSPTAAGKGSVRNSSMVDSIQGQDRASAYLDKGLEMPLIQVNSAPGTAPNFPIRSSLTAPQSGRQLRSALNPKQTHQTLNAVQKLVRRAANNTMAFNGDQQTASNAANMSSSPLPVDPSFWSSFMRNETSSAPTSPTSAPDTSGNMDLDSTAAPTSGDPRFMPYIPDRLGKPKGTTNPTNPPAQQLSNAAATMEVSKDFSVPEGVSLARRGVPAPVKIVKTVSKKHVRDELPDPTEEIDQDDIIEDGIEMMPPPPKKTKTNNESMTLRIKTSKPSGDNKKPEAPELALQPVPEPVSEPVPKKDQAKATAGRSRVVHMESVISGDAMARTKAEAKEGADARFQRLLEHHNSKQKKSKRRHANQATAPDFMPEWFNVKLFPADEKEDQVRCVCGTTHDDGVDMVACDGEECSVWQHKHCVGEALPKDVENEKYYCHVCAPFAHRRIVAQLRKNNPLG